MKPLNQILHRKRLAKNGSDADLLHPHPTTSVSWLKESLCVAGVVFLVAALGQWASICQMEPGQSKHPIVKKIVSLVPSLEQIENLTIDARFQVRGHPTHSPKIFVIALDEASIKQFFDTEEGNKPMAMWGNYHKRVLENLHKAGVSVVGFDIVIPHDFDNAADSATPNQNMARTIKDISQGKTPTRIVLPCQETAPEEGSYEVPNYSLLLSTVNYANLSRENYEKNLGNCIGSEACGFANSVDENDGVVREFWIKHSRSNTHEGSSSAVRDPYYSFARNVARQASLLNFFPGQVLTSEDLQTEEPQYIDFVGPSKTFQPLSYRDVLNESAPFEAVKEKLKGSICLIGDTTAVGKDRHRVSFDSETLMSGVEVQANVVQTILSQQKFWRLRQWKSLFAAIGALLILNLFLWVRLRPDREVQLTKLKRGQSSPFLEFRVAFLLASIWTLCCFIVFMWTNFLLPLTIVSFVLLLNGSILLVRRTYTAAISRFWLKHQFGRYVSDDVLEYLVETPDATKMKGDVRDVTVMFVDIRNFTDFCEPRSQSDKSLRALHETLNGYLGCLEEVIFKYGGTIDKYTGDGLMAIFNWPIVQENHAIRALETAVMMQYGLDVFRRSHTDTADSVASSLMIGIGINTGRAVFGNIGSPNRKSLTVNGDAVNLAARLESINKLQDKELNTSETSGEDIYKPMKVIVGPACVEAIRKNVAAIQNSVLKPASIEYRQGIAVCNHADTAEIRALSGKYMKIRLQDPKNIKGKSNPCEFYDILWLCGLAEMRMDLFEDEIENDKIRPAKLKLLCQLQKNGLPKSVV